MSDAFLSIEDQMEALSRAYVGTIAARAGYDVTRHEVDRDSVDTIISAKGEMRPQIHAQLKASTKIPTAAAQFDFTLSVKNYNDLRIRTQAPRIIIFFAMPKNPKSWLSHNAQRIITRRCAYWKSIHGLPETTNTTGVTIQVDTSQVLDTPTLVALMEKSRAGTPL